MRYLLPLILIITMLSCNGKDSLLPASGGRHYDVIVSGRDSDALSVIDSVLQQPMKALPQSEPMFNLVANVDTLNATTKLARAIVEVNIDARHEGATKIKFTRNLYAEPQIVVRIYAKSVEAMRKDMLVQGKYLSDLLSAWEMETWLAQLKRKHDVKASRMASKMFGADLWLSIDMMYSRKAKDFLWFSNNSATVMKNVCVYRVSCLDNLMAKRDSVWGRNIKGETDDMRMMAVAGTMITDSTCFALKGKAHYNKTVRGLWEMQGDAMGGPFISRMIKDGNKGYLIVDAFLFAPNKDKRNAMRECEAMAYSLKMNKKTN